MTEYLILVGLIAIALIGTVTAFRQKGLEGPFAKMGQVLEQRVGDPIASGGSRPSFGGATPTPASMPLSRPVTEDEETRDAENRPIIASGG